MLLLKSRDHVLFIYILHLTFYFWRLYLAYLVVLICEDYQKHNAKNQKTYWVGFVSSEPGWYGSLFLPQDKKRKNFLNCEIKSHNYLFYPRAETISHRVTQTSDLAYKNMPSLHLLHTYFCKYHLIWCNPMEHFKCGVNIYTVKLNSEIN